MDLAIIESNGNGGDLQLNGNDLAMVWGIENQVYLALFGGNPGFITKSKIEDEQSFDWWGNSLLMPNNQSIQLNSLTEKMLQDVALNSSGRIRIEEAVKKDLEYLKPIATITVEVSIVDVDHIKIFIRIKQNIGSIRVVMIEFKKSIDGDFRISDFNDDFLV